MAAPTDTSATTASSSLMPAACLPPPASAATPHAHGDMAEILPSLPLETRCPPFALRRYNGFWQPEIILADIPAIHAHLQPRPNAVVLASFPKSGTTWLKALAFATLNRATYPPAAADHPLRRSNPHDCVPFLDGGLAPEVLRSPPPLLAAHLPYSMLPERVTGDDGADEAPRIVYVCRNPKDVLVSSWIFANGVKRLPNLPTSSSSTTTTASSGVDGGARSPSHTLDEAFDLFCEGRIMNGPHWRHVLEYWEESLRRPHKVLFLRYEEMLREPASNLRKMAAFMGCAFSEQEEEGGVVDAIVELCSLPKLKTMEVNRKGTNYLAVKNELYFRKGVAGDWSNHLTPEMAKKLDEIVDGALQGSGFAFTS